MPRFTSDLQVFLDELKRRHVVRAATAYLVAAFVVLQAADLVFEGLMVPDWIYRALTILVVVGFPIALVIAWVYEWTSRGLTLDPADQEGAPESSKVRVYALTGLGMVVALATLGLGLPYVYSASGADRMPEGAGAAVPVRQVASLPLKADVVAVLPFAHLTSADGDVGFSDGLTEDIITALAQIEGLDVVSRTTSLGYRDADKAIPVIAAELGAGLILEGTIRRSGDRIRVTAQLIDTRSDTHLWAESYDRELTDVFQVQSELAQEIAAAVQVVVAPDSELDAQERLAANRVYLRGREVLRGGTAMNEAMARELFRQALEANPQLAGAHAGMAETLTLQAVDGRPWLLDTAVVHARRAVEANPRLAEARATMALVLLARGDLDGARVEISRAVELSERDPGAMQEWRARIRDLEPSLPQASALLRQLEATAPAVPAPELPPAQSTTE